MSQLQSTSKAAQPPSLDCMPNSQLMARRSTRCWRPGSLALACSNASSTMAVSSMSG
jgi:hypothetical protein